MYTDEHSNRQPFANIVSAPVHDAHYQRLVDDAIKTSQDFGDLKRLDAHLENIRIYEASILEAEHRSLVVTYSMNGATVPTNSRFPTTTCPAAGKRLTPSTKKTLMFS